MTKTREIYRCTICGNVVEVVNPGAQLSCCGQPMKLMKENTTDGAKEKHVPVIEAIEGGYRVTVGSVEHPMLPEHATSLFLRSFNSFNSSAIEVENFIFPLR